MVFVSQFLLSLLAPAIHIVGVNALGVIKTLKKRVKDVNEATFSNV
jgi:hypothetical protein